MQVLNQLGMKKNWIYEVIVSTYHENNPHSAPIGIWTDDFATLHAEIYKDTQTLKNIMKSREFTINLVADMTVFYKSLFDKTSIAYTRSSKVNAPVIRNVSAFIECSVKGIEEKTNTFHLESTPVHVQSNGTTTLINRAKSLALESLILATKSPHLPEQKVGETLKENHRVIKKVAPNSPYERILEELLVRMGIRKG